MSFLRRGALATRLVLTAIPPILVGVMVLRCSVDVPFWDAWVTGDTYVAALRGGPLWELLWHPHNEHRLLVPKALLLGIALLSSWNTQLECWANLGVALLFYSLVVAAISRESGYRGGRGAGWLAPAVSLIWFSLTPYISWLWGWQIQVTLCLLSSFAALALLSSSRRAATSIGGAVVCAVVASFSFGAGLLCWPAGVAVLLLRPFPRPQRRWIQLGLWGAAASITATLFLVGNPATTAHLADGGWLDRPREMLTYVVLYLGRPLGASVAGWAGVVGLGLLTAAMFKLLRIEPEARLGLLPFLGMGLLVAGSAVLTARSRMMDGLEQALVARYRPLACAFWVSVIVLLWLWPRGAEQKPSRGIGVIIGVVLVAAALASAAEVPSYSSFQNHLQCGQAELLFLESEVHMRRLYPETAVVTRITRDVLIPYRLSVFRRMAPEARLVLDPLPGLTYPKE